MSSATFFKNIWILLLFHANCYADEDTIGFVASVFDIPCASSDSKHEVRECLEKELRARFLNSSRSEAISGIADIGFKFVEKGIEPRIEYEKNGFALVLKRKYADHSYLEVVVFFAFADDMDFDFVAIGTHRGRTG